MRKRTLIFLFLSVLFLSAIVFPLQTNPQYTGSDYTETKAKVDATVNLSTALTYYDGTPLPSGSRICNASVNLLATPYSVYASNPAQTSIGVECTRVVNNSCVGYASGSPGMPSANISWTSQSNYNAILSSFSVNEAPIFNSLPLPTYAGITFYPITADYYKFAPPTAFVGTGTASISLFCYGNSAVTYTYGGSTLPVPGASTQMSSTTAISFTKTATDTGNYTFNSGATIGSCSAITRSWNTVGVADPTHPVLDRILSDPLNTLSNANLASPPVTITVFRGPVMNVTSFTTDSLITPGTTGAFTAILRNDGDINMSVNPAGIAFTSGFTLVSVVPATSFILAPGASQAVTVTGMLRAPATEGVYVVSIIVPYQSTETLIGTCDDAATLTSSINTTITVSTCPALIVSLGLNPATLVDDQRVNFTITVNNAGMAVNIAQTDIAFTNLSDIRFDTAFPVTLNPGATTIQGSGVAIFGGTYNVQVNVTYPVVGICPAGSAIASTSLTVVCPSISASLGLNPRILGDNQRVNFTITVNNGGRPVSISQTDIAFTNLSDINFDTAFPVTLNAGTTNIQGYGFTRIVGAYDVQVNVNYPGVGICPAGGTIAFGGLTVLGPLTLTLKVAPSSIIHSTNHDVSINVTAYRGGQEVPPIGGNYTIQKWDGSAWIFAPTWTWKSLGFTYSSSSTSTTEIYANASMIEDVHSQYSPFDDWDVGVYKVTAVVNDRNRGETIPISNYFVIYLLDCGDR